MAYPLIILGAGASFDSLERDRYLKGVYRQPDLIQYQPPLTNDIFDESRFYDILRQHPYAADLASHAVTKVGNTIGFEEYITDIFLNRAPKNEIRYKQIISLRYYLQHLFRFISAKYHRTGSNYNALVNLIHDNGGKALIVNFNYDSLFENHIRSIYNSLKIDSYISSPIKVVKIHGSHDWVFIGQEMPLPHEVQDAEKYFTEKFAQHFATRDFQDRIYIKKMNDSWGYREYVGNDLIYYLPAIAIPLTHNKSYVCPENHINALVDDLSKIDRILIIGWQGNDPYLLEKMKKHIPNRLIPVTIVSRSSGSKIAEKLDGIVSNTVIRLANENTFTKFVQSEECEEFFSE